MADSAAEESVLGYQPSDAEVQGVDFLQFYIDHSVTMEGKISSQRIKRLEVAVQEININFHQYALNHVLSFVASLVELLPDELIAEFLRTDTLFNYERLMEVIAIQDEEFQAKIRTQEGVEPAAPQAWDLERAEKVRRTMHRLQGVLSPVPPDPEGEEVVQEEAEVREEEKRPKSIMRLVKTKEEVCPVLAADIVRFEEGEEYNQTKILVQSISIKALRIYLTFRIQQLDSAMGV